MINENNCPRLKDNLYAIIIGVEKYLDTEFVNIPAAANDARCLYDFLVNKWNLDAKHIICPSRDNNGKVLYDEAKKAIDTMKNKLHEEDKLLFFFSGHGIIGDGKGLSYMTFTDSQKNDKGEMDNVISLYYLNKAMMKCKAQIKVRLFDCCHSGESFSDLEDYLRPDAIPEHLYPEAVESADIPLSKELSPAMKEEFYKDIMKNKASWATFCSCNIDEVSEAAKYKGNNEQRSLFSNYLVKYLEKTSALKTPCYIEDMKIYIYREMLEDYRKKKWLFSLSGGIHHRKPQHMVYQCSLSGNLQVN